MAAPNLRPLGIGEVLDVAIKVYTRNAVALWTLVVAVVAPLSLVSTIVTASATPTELEDIGFDSETGELVGTSENEIWTFLAGAGVGVLLLLLGTVLASGACFKAVADTYLGTPVDWRGSLRFVVRRLHSVLWVSFLTVLVAGLGFLLCIIPGIYFWFCFVVAVPALLTEQVKGRRALRRSRQLVRGRWWPVFAVIMLGTILTSIVGGVISGLATFVGGEDTATVGWIVSNWLAETISSTLTTPFTAAVAIVLYFDLRVRKEAFDLELLASQLGVEPSPDAAPRLIEPLVERPEHAGDEPPFWPPPPGWKPRSHEPDADHDDT